MASLEDDDEDDVSDYQTPVICADCEGHKNVNSYCLGCNVDICDKCKNRKLHRKHRILPRTHREVRKARKTVREPCKNHPDKEFVTFCKRCNVPCCPDCISTEHFQHPFMDIEKAAEEAKSEIEARLQIFQGSTLPSAEQNHNRLIQGISEYFDILEKAKLKTQEKFSNLRKEIDNAESDITKEFEDLEANDTSDMQKMKHLSEDTINRIKGIINNFKSNLSEDSELELLKFRLEFPGVDTVQLMPISLPPLVQFAPSRYRLPETSELVGQITFGNKREFRSILDTIQEGDKDITTQFNVSLLDVKILKTVNGINATRMLQHTDNSLMVSSDIDGSLSRYDEEVVLKERHNIGLNICDMILLSSNDIMATEWSKQRLVKISSNGMVTAFCSTSPLYPNGLCINDMHQIVVGLNSKVAGMPPVKLRVYSSNSPSVLKEIEEDKSGKRLFREVIRQVKQNGNQHYVVADDNRVVCVSCEGRFMWEHTVKKGGNSYTIQSLECDRYNNIIIAENNNDKISLLSVDGTLIKSLLTSSEGIHRPFSISIDKKGYLFIGQMEPTQIIIVKYLK